MNTKNLAMMWDQMRLCHGIAMRVIEQLPEDQLDRHPIPHMRTPKELIAHMYSLVQGIGEGVPQGEIKASDDEKVLASRMSDRKAVLEFARACWDAADRGVAATTDAHLQAMVKTPWDVEFPGAYCFVIANDEYLHHRGQLFAFLRALGGEPPMMWDFENNAPEYRPKAKAQA